MDAIVTLTEKAIKQVEAIGQSESESNQSSSRGLRLAVIGGGCSGLSYKIEFSERKDKDNVFDYENFSLLIDPKSSIYLKGVTLDFQDGLNGKGFVFVNPNAKNTCGCGESFTI